jgi:signal transduction histidine kinase/CheY-like chemotaxis protein
VTSRAPSEGDVPQHIVSVLHERVAAAADDPVADAPIVAERLESLGLLAGGIAHDFNNVLAVIRGSVEFARDAITGPQPDLREAGADLQAVERATDRATALVRQLLAFGRMQTRAPESLDLNAVVRDVAPLLRLSIGADARLALRLAPELPRVLADRTQIEQVLMNLVGNARDAVAEAVARDAETGVRDPGGGRRGITIVTATERLDAAGAGRLGVASAGEYVRVEVRDAGIGMTDETRARVFEPFFTTKSVDRGTGLGLAATWGIVRQSGGAIRVESRLSEGSTFSVYLPALAAPAVDAHAPDVVEEEAAPTAPAVAPDDRPRDGRDAPNTILLVEDDHGVRRVAARVLRSAGYRVLEAGDGVDALELWRRHADEVDLLLADVRMPRLRGDELARAVLAERPSLAVVLMTGFGVDGGTVPNGNGFGPPLAKPFPNDALLERVAGALARVESRG